jgi:hypothetical protein
LVTKLIAACPEAAEAGRRLTGNAPLVAGALRAMRPVADACLAGTRPVRAVLFDNWAVPWHQDRTIAVSHRADVPGFGPWSVKDGVPHVEPPFALLAAMVTLRLHLDPCPEDNAPLLVALGSHRRQVAAAHAASVADNCDQRLCTAAAGDIWAYATPILHRSDRARRPSHRRVVQVDFAAGELPPLLEWAA